jgi:hypothetical protein
MQFTADQVWGSAVAADRINDGYIKEDEVVWENNCRKVLKQANKMMVKNWLRTNDFVEVTAADIEQGRVVRHYFNGLLLKELSGKINDFERQALKIAQKEEFTGRDMLDFAIVSCLPAAMLRDQARKELDSSIRSSTQLDAAVGDKIQGYIDVVKCHYNQNYNRFRVTATLGDSYVDFWFGTALEGRVGIKAKVKAQRGDNTTQLNFVKITG